MIILNSMNIVNIRASARFYIVNVYEHFSALMFMLLTVIPHAALKFHLLTFLSPNMLSFNFVNMCSALIFLTL